MYVVVYIYYNVDILQKTHDFFRKSKELMIYTERNVVYSYNNFKT